MRPILGHNQFIGVCHTSDSRAREMDDRFSMPENILKVVEEAHDIGFRSMIVETHPRMLDFLRLYEEAQTVNMNLILQTPYVQTYVRKMGTTGIRGIAFDLIKESNPSAAARGAIRSLKDILSSKYANLGATGLEFGAAEYFQFNIKKVMIHNAITDLLLALNMQEVLIAAKERIEHDYGVKVGFITLNLPMLLEGMAEYDGSYDIMTPVNPIGFDMNPSQERVVESIWKTRHSVTAMNILGGGSVSIADSARYLHSIGKIEECVIGSSNPVHLREDYDYLTMKIVKAETSFQAEECSMEPLPAKMPVLIKSPVGQ